MLLSKISNIHKTKSDNFITRIFSVMIIGIFPNSLKSQSRTIAISIREFLTTNGVTVVAEDSQAQDISAVPISTIDPKTIDFIISLGGDGTILRLVHKHPEITAPLLGINMGSLGFMADVPITEIYPGLQDLIDGAYEIEERIVMGGETINGEKDFAVNDVVIHRAKICA